MSKRKDREYLIPKAQELRLAGLSAKEIGDQLGLPKGTVGHWIEGVPIGETHRR